MAKPVPAETAAGVVEHNVACSRCSALVLDPVAAPCGDVQCSSCFQQWLQQAAPCGSVTCPACNQSFHAHALVGTGVCTALQLLLGRLFPAAIAVRRLQASSAARGSVSCASAAGNLNPAILAAAAAAGVSDGGESLLEASDESCHHMDDKPSPQYPSRAPGGGDGSSGGGGKRGRSASPADDDDGQLDLLPPKRAMSDITPIPVRAAHHALSKTASASWPGPPHDVVLGVPLQDFTATWAAATAHAGQANVSDAAVWAATAAAFGAFNAGAASRSTFSAVAPGTATSATAAAAAVLSQPWHSVEDTLSRVTVARTLLVLLRARGLVRAVGEKLVLRAVQHMELVMYRRAVSLAEYSDVGTLERRAVEVLDGRAQERRRAQAAAAASAAPRSS